MIKPVVVPVPVTLGNGASRSVGNGASRSPGNGASRSPGNGASRSPGNGASRSPGKGEARLEAMPASGPLVDTFGRIHADMRVSITDRCNLRCVYCMPEEGVPFRPREEILTFEEIARVARVAHGLGVTSLRITGGEPLVRRGVVELVGQLSGIGFEDLAMTTNGTGLDALARPLSEAGLKRVNVSCDSLRPERFSRIRRRGSLERALTAMDAAEDAGLVPLKVNVVLLRGVNDDEVLEFAAFGRKHHRTVRFIEYMPLGGDGTWRREQVVQSEDVLQEIHARWPIVPAAEPGDPSPAERYRYLDGAGEIGVVGSVTRPFCGTCNRLRLTADGAIRNCLFSDDEAPIRALLRSGADDEEVAMALRRSVWSKLPGHGINDPGFLQPVRSMSMIGG